MTNCLLNALRAHRLNGSLGKASPSPHRRVAYEVSLSRGSGPYG
jgi:hypothetical protein